MKTVSIGGEQFRIQNAVVVIGADGEPLQPGTALSGDASAANQNTQTTALNTIAARLQTLIDAIGAAGDAGGDSTVIGLLKEIAAGTEYNFFYDFSVDGGAAGPIVLRGDNPIPEGFVIVAAFKELITPLDSAAHTATAALTSNEAAGDILAATIVSNAAWTTLGTTGLHIVKKTTAQRVPSLVVAGQDLTAGKFTLHIDGYLAP